MLAWVGPDGVGDGPCELVVQPGQSLQLCGQRPVPQAFGQLRLGQRQPGLGVGIAGLAADARGRLQNAAQPGLGCGRKRLVHRVTGNPCRVVEPAGRGQGFGGGH